MGDIAGAGRAFPADGLLGAGSFLPVVQFLDADVAEGVVAWADTVE